MSTFCLDCVVYNSNGSLLENVSHSLAAGDQRASYGRASGTLVLADIAQSVSSVHFYSLPSVLTFGLVFSLFNAACLAKSCRSSVDCHLAALALISAGATGLAGAIHAPGYADTFAWYPRLVVICAGLQDWLGAAYTWTLLVLCAERRLTVKRMRRNAYCGCLQAGLAVLMVAMVTLVATLPQLWIKEVQESVEPISSRTNATVLKIRSSSEGMRPEYTVLYQCFRDLASVLIPGPVLSVLVCQLLCCSRAYNRHQSQLMKAASSGPRIQQTQQQVESNRLSVILGCCHLMLSFPMLALLLLWGHRPAWLPEESFRPLYQLFSLLYYLYYPLAFLLHVCFLTDYRSRMRRLFCSESCQYTTYVVE